jgi:hypothetical protein
MKPIKLIDSTGSLDERTIAKFESSIGSPLPADYRAFLKTTNGGQVHKANSCISFPDEDHPFGLKEVIVEYFYNLVGTGASTLELDYEFLSMKSRIPEEVISIGKDGMGNLILLQISGETIGCVFFWDHESEGCQGGDLWDNIYFLAAGFSDFCERLVQNPYAD